MVKALNLRVNPQRLYRAKNLASQNGAYGDTEFYSGPTSYLNITFAKDENIPTKL